MGRRAWLWSPVYVADEVRSERVLKFCVIKGIDTIYLWFSFNTSASYYRSFIRKANAVGVKVHAVFGEPSMYDPAKYKEKGGLFERLSVLDSFQRSSAFDEMFAGVHLDIEPHTLAEWRNEETRPMVKEKWGETMELYVSDIKHTLGLPVSAALPIALGNGTNDELARKAILLHDQVAIMSYRNQAYGNDSIVTHVNPFIIFAANLLKPNCVIASVETKDVHPEPEKLTFYHQGEKAMNEQIRLVEYYYGQETAFAGISVHSIEYWMELHYEIKEEDL
ncbi:hypothetical protein D1872_81540 [compost metagenome]